MVDKKKDKIGKISKDEMMNMVMFSVIYWIIAGFIIGHVQTYYDSIIYVGIFPFAAQDSMIGLAIGIFGIIFAIIGIKYKNG